MKALFPINHSSGRLECRPVSFRRIFSFLLPFGFLLCFASFLVAQDDSAPAGPVRPTDELTVVNRTVFPHEVTLYEFSNGLTLMIRQTQTDTATVRAYIKNTGSVHEGEYLGSGISHLTEHVVCGGSTARRTEEETRHLLERLGGSFNAQTGKAITSYYIDCTSETISTALDLITDWLNHAEIAPDTVTREKQVILRELADAEEDPVRAESDLLLKTLYRVHPFRHPAGGYSDLFANLSHDEVKAFYDAHYTPNNTVLFVAGKADEEKIVARVTAAYRDIPRGKEFEPVLFSEPAQIAPREAGREMDGKMFRLLLAWPTTRLEDPDTFALDVLGTLLTGGTAGRLTRRLKEEKQLGFSYDAELFTPSSAPGFFLIRVETRPEEVDAVRVAILDQIRQLTEFGVSDDELARAKKITEAAFLRTRETVSDTADDCAMNYILTGNPNFDQTYLEAVRNVSSADITRAAGAYLRAETLNTILISPPGMAPASVTSDRGQNDSEILGFNMQENGLRLLAKRVSALPTVTVQIYAIGGSLVENESTAGTCALLADMLGRGTVNHTKTELEDYFDAIGGEFAFDAGRNTLSGEMTVLKEDFEKGFPLFAEMFLRPAFSESEFQNAKKNQLDKILALESSPTGQLFSLFSDSLPASTPYHLRINGTAETVDKIRLDDVRRMHRRLLAPGRMIIAVFGDIDPQDAAYTAKELFSELPVESVGDPILFDRDNSFSRQPDEHRRINAPVGMGIAAWPSVSFGDRKEYAVLTVLKAALGGYAGPGGRLFNALREEGFVYSLGVQQMTGPAPGYFYVSFETSPEKVGRVFERIEAEIERIKGGDLSEEELARIKEEIIAARPRILETASDQARQASLADLYGLGYNYEKNFAEQINAVTRDEVIAAAQKFFVRPAKVSLSNLSGRP